MNADQPTILLCAHCGNSAPHRLEFQYEFKAVEDLIEYQEDGEDAADELWTPIEYFAFSCGTCRGLNIYGGFRSLRGRSAGPPYEHPRLHPIGPDILPPDHTLATAEPVPPQVLHAYRKAWPLIRTAPGPFANQIRRALEILCEDQEASGDNLLGMLHTLASRGIFPPEIAETADLIRKVGNIPSHASTKELDYWDAELIDELFKTILRYVYLTPSHVRRLRQRVGAA